MKRYFSIIAILLLLLGVVGCSKTPGTDASSNNAANEEPAREKISGEIMAASVFSEGLAFVVTDANPDVTLCINIKGEILFTLNEDISSVSGIDEKFENGMVLVHESTMGKTAYFCDTEGNITYPEDVGVTQFYDVALTEGYIIATVDTATYASTKQELGVMDLNFQWVVQPSEELYQNISFSIAIYNNDFCSHGFVYSESTKKYMNLSNGEIYEEMPEALRGESSLWRGSGDCYYDVAGNKVLDLSEHINISHLGDFVDGKAVILFYNSTVNKYYMTRIDEAGTFEYEPVELPIDFSANKSMQTDGQYLLLTNVGHTVGKAACFDMQGNLIGSFDLESRTESYRLELSDGVIMKCRTAQQKNKIRSWYLNPDSTPLF